MAWFILSEDEGTPAHHERDKKSYYARSIPKHSSWAGVEGYERKCITM